MTVSELLFPYLMAGFFLSMVLYVVVGQITVRRLRKNPEIRRLLGMELASGWDILNVAGALSRPKCFSEMVRNSPLSFLAADERPLYANTNIVERCIARVFFWSWITSGMTGGLLGLLVMAGLIE